MITAGQRLKDIAGVGGAAGVLLLLIGNGATAGEALVNYSQLPTGTAAEHLMVDRVLIHGGGGHPHHHRHEFKRPPSISQLLDVAMSELYEAGTKKEIPLATKQAFANIVKPYAKGKSKIPEVDQVNWMALEADVAKVEQLLALWQMLLDDEEIIIMAYLAYYH